MSDASLLADESGAPSGKLMVGLSAAAAPIIGNDLSQFLQNPWRSYGFWGPVHTETILHLIADTVGAPLDLALDSLCT